MKSLPLWKIKSSPNMRLRLPAMFLSLQQIAEAPSVGRQKADIFRAIWASVGEKCIKALTLPAQTAALARQFTQRKMERLKRQGRRTDMEIRLLSTSITELKHCTRICRLET